VEYSLSLSVCKSRSVLIQARLKNMNLEIFARWLTSDHQRKDSLKIIETTSDFTALEDSRP
jgi:hypothetical protein